MTEKNCLNIMKKQMYTGALSHIKPKQNQNLGIMMYKVLCPLIMIIEIEMHKTSVHFFFISTLVEIDFFLIQLI